jgi:hypothetical protein
MSLATVLSELAKLNKKELATVRAAIEQLLGPDKALASPPVALTLYEAVRVAGGQDKLPLERVKRFGWVRFSTEAALFIESTWPQAKHNKIVRMGLERLLISLLIEDLRGKNINITVGSVVRNLGRLPEVFDSEFPGYRINKLQSLILKAMEKR